MINTDSEYDIAILGAGPAGLTAAIYAGRYKLKTIIISEDFGGISTGSERIENWPGFIGSGSELTKRFVKHAKKFGAEFLQDKIEKVCMINNKFSVTTTKRKILSKSILLALGSKIKRLEIPGEKKFIGKGVSYCAICDKNFFKNKIVAVVGGGDSATKAVILLSDVAKKVYVICRKDQLKCKKSVSKKISLIKNVEILYNSVLLKISGDKIVNKIKIQTGNIKKEIDVNGVFIKIGAVPNELIAKGLGLKTDKHSFIKIDRNSKTNVRGVFAAGDVTDHPLRQIITSAAEGAVAVKSAYQLLKKDKLN